MIGNGLQPCSFCEVCVPIPFYRVTPGSHKNTKTQKHQATCTYEPPVPKPPSQLSDPPSESHSTITASSHHARNLSSGDSAVSGLVSEQASEFAHDDYHLWSDVAGFDSFEEGLSLGGYIMDASTHDTEAVTDTLLFDPATSLLTANAPEFGIQDLDWPSSPEKQSESLTGRGQLCVFLSTNIHHP